MSRPQPIPANQTFATPYLSIRGASDAIAFYVRAFGAEETMSIRGPDGSVGHAELRIGRAMIMLADEHPATGFMSPAALGNTSVSIHIYVADVDVLVARAVAEGATLDRPVKDEFYGDRVAILRDPFGHRWMFATRFEDVSAEEMQKRAAALYAG